MLGKLIKDVFLKFGIQLTRANPSYPILAPIDVNGVEILADPEFRKSCSEVSKLSQLDTPRLANLWCLCRMSNPKGNIIEIGSYKGGGALHLSNSSPGRRIIICDSFEKSFEALDPNLDYSFKYDHFVDNSKSAVASNMKRVGKDFLILDGFFPDSVGNNDIGPISFVHLDVDIYQATIDSLLYLQEKNLFIEKSLIVFDDYNRRADGLNKAVNEFSRKYPEWQPFPIFPSQCLLLHKSWFE